MDEEVQSHLYIINQEIKSFDKKVSVCNISKLCSNSKIIIRKILIIY